MKTESVYVTVKIDIECPSDMTYSEDHEGVLSERTPKNYK